MSVSERVLHATYHVAPTRGPRWTTRTLARYLGLNHMVVQRIWQARGVRPREVPVAEERLSFVRPHPSVDLLGVFVRPPVRAAVFGIENVTASHLDPRSTYRTVFQPEISGGYLIRSSIRNSEDLTELLKGVQTTVTLPESAGSGIRDLLILLRDLEERTPTTTQVHVISQSEPDAEDGRLTHWMEGHPRFYLHRVPVDQEWPAGVQSFLAQWEPSTLHRSSFQGVPLFALAAVRHAGSLAPDSTGLIWSISGAFQRTGQMRVGRIIVTDLASPEVQSPEPVVTDPVTSGGSSVREKLPLQNATH